MLALKKMIFKRNTKYYFRRKDALCDDSTASLKIGGDGSAILEEPNGMVTIFEETTDAWQEAIRKLETEGWEESRSQQAKREFDLKARLMK